MLAPARPSEPSASFRCGDWLYHGLPISENRSLKSDNQMAQFEDLYSRGNLYTGGVYDTRSCPAAYAWPTLRTRTLLTREDSRNECSMHREGAGGGGAGSPWMLAPWMEMRGTWFPVKKEVSTCGAAFA